MQPRHTLLAALPLLLPFSIAQAESPLNAVVVTATRVESRVSEVLADVTVIDRDEIERFAGGTIVDLLGQQPGIQFSTNGGAGTPANLYVRGARPDQTKVLVDGLPINSLDLNGSPLRFLSLSNVERIEILRGPGSTLYGADAIGGVIQIFTRTGSPGLKADGFAGVGTQNTRQMATGVSGGNQQWRFRVEGSHEYSGGISAQRNASNQDADRDAYRNSAGAASLSFLPGAGQELGMSYRRNSGRTHYDNVPADGSFDAYVDFRTEQWQVFSRNRLTQQWRSTLQYGQTTDWQRNLASWAPTGNELRTDTSLLSWQNDLALPVGKAIIGAEHLTQKAASTDGFASDPRNTSNGVFAAWIASLGQHRWQISGRSDHFTRFSDKNTYALAYGYLLTSAWRIKASLGTSFKAPSLYQLYDPFSGNAQLNPEQAKNREAGVVWQRGAQTASATYYLNRIENMIDWSSTTFRFENVARARLEGLTLAYLGSFGHWSVRATYDRLDATSEDTGLRLGRRAKNRALLGVSRHWGAFAAGVELVGVGSRYDTNAETERLGGYGLVNLTTRYALSKTLALEGRVNNLFDKGYELTGGYNTLGVNAFMGVRYTPR